MEQKDAQRVASTWNQAQRSGRSWPAGAERQSDEELARAWQQVYGALIWLIPDGIDEAATTVDQDRPPVINLLDASGVYQLRCVEITDREGRSHIRRVALDGSSAVEATSTVVDGIGYTTARVEWKIQIGDHQPLEYVVEANTARDGHGDYEFVSALVRRLGWDVPQLAVVD